MSPPIITTVPFEWSIRGYLRNRAAGIVQGNPITTIAILIIVSVLRHPRLTLPSAIYFGLVIWLHSWKMAALFFAYAFIVPVLVMLAIVLAIPQSRAWTVQAYLARQRKLRLKDTWLIVCEATGLGMRNGRNAVPLHEVRKDSANSVSAIVVPGDIGLTVDAVVKYARNIAAINHCQHVLVREIDDPGTAIIKLLWGDPLERLIEPIDIPPAPYKQIAIGVLENGEPAYFDPFLSILVGGRTGSGKSRLIWAYILGLILSGIPFRLRIIDPAGGVELHYLQPKSSPYVIDYTYKAIDAEIVIEGAFEALMQRLEGMPEGVSQHIPTREEPLDITIIDEFLMLGPILKEGALSQLGQLEAIGRKGAYAVIGASQVNEKITMGPVRDIFPQRACFAVNTAEQANMVLGSSATTMGADPHRIPRNLRGVGWMMTESGLYMRFRTPFIDDKMTKKIASGHLPAGLHEARGAYFAIQDGKKLFRNKENRPEYYEVASDGYKNEQATTLYFWSDACDISCGHIHGELLYVGISFNALKRAEQHGENKNWWVTHELSARTKNYATRQEALDAEKEAIQTLHPRYNIQHAGVR